jgi:hypothetical protein
MHAGGQGRGLPSNLAVSSGKAKLLDNNNAPNINILTNTFFIESSPQLSKSSTYDSLMLCRIHNNPLALLLFSEYGTNFSQNGNLGEDESGSLPIRAS